MLPDVPFGKGNTELHFKAQDYSEDDWQFRNIKKKKLR